MDKSKWMMLPPEERRRRLGVMADRYKRKRASMSTEELELFREKQRLYMAEQRGKKPEKYYVYTRDRRLSNRAWADEYKRNLKCQKCGHSHPASLDFHHPNPEEKERSISNAVLLSRKKLMEEMAKCIVLCANCHRQLHYELRRKEDGDGTQV